MSFSQEVKTELKNKSFTSKKRHSKISVGSVSGKTDRLRELFLSCGSVNDPEKSYLMEFVFPEVGKATEMKELIDSLGFTSRVIERKDSFVTYVQDADAISDLLGMMGAHRSLLEYENMRILKEMRGNVQRKVNCETANLQKTVTASVRQIDDIEYIEENLGFDRLSPELSETAELRLAMPDATLSELAAASVPPQGRSCINHRLRKLSKIASELRQQSEGNQKK